MCGTRGLVSPSNSSSAVRRRVGLLTLENTPPQFKKGGVMTLNEKMKEELTKTYWSTPLYVCQFLKLTAGLGILVKISPLGSRITHKRSTLHTDRDRSWQDYSDLQPRIVFGISHFFKQDVIPQMYTGLGNHGPWFYPPLPTGLGSTTKNSTRKHSSIAACSHPSTRIVQLLVSRFLFVIGSSTDHPEIAKSDAWHLI